MKNDIQRQWWRKPLQRPAALRKGDRIAVVSPSWGGPAAFPHRYRAGKCYLEDHFGVEVVEMPHALRPAAWIYQNPEARADDLMRAFGDRSINGIIASIGGDDAVRLIPYLDLGIVQDNPKVFVGYSDPTALHFACLKAGVGSFHGPSVMSGFAENGGMSGVSHEAFRRAVFDTRPIGTLAHAIDGWTAEELDWSNPANQQLLRPRFESSGLQLLRGKNSVRGHLIGGCAEVLEMLKATSWWPPLDYWDKAILFYETSEEAPSDSYVLRWFRNFAAEGILHRLSAIVLGRPGGLMDGAKRAAQKAAILRALDEAGLHDLPVIADADIGHTDPLHTLPYGALAEIDVNRVAISILEPGVV